MNQNKKGSRTDMRCRTYIQATLMLAAFPGLALAAEGDVTGEAEEAGFKIMAGAGVRAVDNLFASSSNRVSDVITTGTLGFSMKAGYSRQRLALDAAFNDNRYEAHPDWNYVGNNLAANWQWSSGTGLHGAVTGSQVTAQNPTTVNAGSTQRNLNTTQNSQASIGYELSGGWDLFSGLVYTNSRNEGAVLGQTNYQYHGTFVGATYTFRSGNTLTLTTQNASGTNLYDYTIRSSELKFASKDPDTVSYTWQLIQWNQSYALRPEFDFSVLGGGGHCGLAHHVQDIAGPVGAAAVLRQPQCHLHLFHVGFPHAVAGLGGLAQGDPAGYHPVRRDA